MSKLFSAIEFQDVKSSKDDVYVDELRADEAVLLQTENRAIIEKWLNGLKPLVREAMILSLGINTQPILANAVAEKLDRGVMSISNYRKSALASLELLAGSGENDALQNAVLRLLAKRKNELKNSLDIEIAEPPIKASNEFKKRAGRPRKVNQPSAESDEIDRASQYDVPDKAEGYEKLSFEETRELVLKWQNGRDRNALNRLTASHIKYINFLASKLSGYGLLAEDIAQEGVIGYMKALDRYDPDYRSPNNPNNRTSLLSFASWQIRADMNEYIIRNWQIVKAATTKDQRKLFFKMRGAANKVGAEFGVGLTDDQVEEIADDLGVKPSSVKGMESSVLGSGVHDTSVDEYAEFGRSGSVEQEVAEEEYLGTRAEIYQQGLASLDNRSRVIVESRAPEDPDDKRTLHCLADEFDVSAERIRQIEIKAKEALKAFVKASGLYGVQEESPARDVVAVRHYENG